MQYFTFSDTIEKELLNQEKNVVDEMNTNKEALGEEELSQEIYSKEPCAGIVFRSYDEVMNFYEKYGRRKGFVVRIQNSYKTVDGRSRRIVFTWECRNHIEKA